MNKKIKVSEHVNLFLNLKRKKKILNLKCTDHKIQISIGKSNQEKNRALVNFAKYQTQTEPVYS